MSSWADGEGWTKEGVSLGRQGPVDRPTDLVEKIKLYINYH